MGNASTRIRHWLYACFLSLCTLSPAAHATAPQESAAEQRWQHQVRALISRNVVYPSNARTEGASGKVVVHLTLKRDGSIESLEIAESAGSRDLDSAVLNAIRRVRHFPPFPEEMADKDSVAFAIPVDFHLDTPTPNPYNPPAPGTVRPKVKSSSPAADEFSEFLKSLSKKER